MRSSSTSLVALPALLLSLLITSPVFAQDEPAAAETSQECAALTIPPDSPQQSKVRELYRNYDVCGNERVEVEGTVKQYAEGPNTTTGFYYLADRFGVWIKVRAPSIEALPPINSTHRVSGIVGYDRVRIDRREDDWRTDYPEPVRALLVVEPGGIYISEPFISEDGACPEGQTRDASGNCVASIPPCGENEVRSGETCICREGYKRNEAGICDHGGFTWLWVGVGLAALLLIGLGVALMRTLNAKPSSTTGTTTRVPSSTPSGTPSSTPPSGTPAGTPIPQVVEGKTIKMHLPPDDKTVKVLPGRFKVKGGLDDITEVRFFMPQGRSTTEITFGRTEGRPYEHIQLKPRTVSSRQAKLVFDGGKYTLYNHASTESNPTTHNGRRLGEGESILLNDGDRVTMGEVEFEFAAS